MAATWMPAMESFLQGLRFYGSAIDVQRHELCQLVLLREWAVRIFGTDDAKVSSAPSSLCLAATVASSLGLFRFMCRLLAKSLPPHSLTGISVVVRFRFRGCRRRPGVVTFF
jgi:hypothetical protein